MAQQTIDVGTTANDGTGDPIRDAFVKCNANFDELYGGTGAGGTITEETGTTYSATAADFPKTKEFNNASAIALTIPVDLDVATNTVFEIHQTGAGAVTIAGASGVTVQSEGGKLTTRGQYAIAGIKRVAANVYRVTGNVTA